MQHLVSLLLLVAYANADSLENFNIALTSTEIGNMAMSRSDFAATSIHVVDAGRHDYIVLTGGCNGSNTYNEFAGFFTCDSVTATSEVWDVTDNVHVDRNNTMLQVRNLRR